MIPMFNIAMLSGTATRFGMQNSYPSFNVFILQKILLGLNRINLKGAGVMGQIFHENLSSPVL